jgi:GH15 family glucan-1,4-alpha-glucosidase
VTHDAAQPQHEERPIADYALIGNCRSAALVSRQGSIDWLCWPRFDSPSVFAALLDRDRGGCFRVQPTAPFDTERRYHPDTNVLETTFSTSEGSVVLRDLMTMPEADGRHSPAPAHEVLREIEGIEGTVELEVLYEPRPGYARKRPRLEHRDAWGIWTTCERGALLLRSDLPLSLSHDGATAGCIVSISAGELAHLSLGWDGDGPAVVPALGEHAHERVARTARWWREWVAGICYDGPFRDAVVRSALVVKLLSYAPSGAIIVAPTTSLPAVPGGGENWDARHCTLRDSAATVRALYALGCATEAGALARWMFTSTQLTWPQLEPVYDVYGRRGPRERELEHLAGYAGSQPVRAGWQHWPTLPLDIYGEVTDVALRYAEHGGQIDRDAARLLRSIGDIVHRLWREPDEGRWFSGEGYERQQHVTTKVLCWVALDRLVRLHERFGLEIPAELYRAERRALRAEIEERGYDPRIASFTRTYDSQEVDATLLLLPLVEFIEGTHSRVHSTLVRVFRQLGRGVLLYRALDPDGNVPREGTHAASAFWLAEAQGMAGDTLGASRRIERLVRYANDVGLFAEQIAPDSGAALGNFPHGATHVSLINAALTIHALQQPRHAPIDERHRRWEDE